jgi:hypothetical protein
MESEAPARVPAMAPAAVQSRQVRAKMTGKTAGPTNLLCYIHIYILKYRESE